MGPFARFGFVEFQESVDFSENRERNFGSDEGYRAFQSFLVKDPTAGAVIPGCGGLRKIRWLAPNRGKGKRGGIRIIYIYVPEVDRIFLITTYGKDEIEDLTPAEKNAWAEFAQLYRAEVLRKRR